MNRRESSGDRRWRQASPDRDCRYRLFLSTALTIEMTDEIVEAPKIDTSAPGTTTLCASPWNPDP